MSDTAMALGDYATWASAAVALGAAYFTWQQAKLAKAQLEASASAARDDDERRRKRVAIDLAEEWCRTEAPSPISILRECLIASDQTAIEALLAGRELTLPAQFRDQVRTFIASVLGGHVGDDGLRSGGENTVTLSENYSHLVRDFFARRINFLEVVAAAFNSELADSNLVEQFFGRIIATNASYAMAVEIDPAAWPELASFYKTSRAAARARSATAHEPPTLRRSND